MTPNLILLNVLSLGLICVLALFARHNKKVGWTKTRSTFVEDLRTLQQDWVEQDRQAVLPQTMPQAISQTMPQAKILAIPSHDSAPITVSNFATQLASLHTALKETAPQVEVSNSLAETRDLVSR